jgi:hypothetical protein
MRVMPFELARLESLGTNLSFKIRARIFIEPSEGSMPNVEGGERRPTAIKPAQIGTFVRIAHPEFRAGFDNRVL